jgi:myo-inositol-1(or 4)-monophosphatase
MREELNICIEACRAAGEILLGYYRGSYDLTDKGHDNPVTSADIEADACLKAILLGAYPEYGWLSEETTDDPARLQKERVWIVDPMDGTKEFVEQIPEFAVSVALVDGGTPVVGVIFNPATSELFVATKGGGTFLNGKRVYSTETIRLAEATLIVSRSEEKRGEVDLFRSHLGAVRAVGSVAYKLARVAAGMGDLNVSVQPKNEWDVCAGDLLVREAGGEMLDLDRQVRLYNQIDPLIRGGLVAGNREICEAMLDVVKSGARGSPGRIAG